MNCVHHWVISTPNGSPMTGECRHCAATKTFQLPEDGWGWRESSIVQGGGGSWLYNGPAPMRRGLVDGGE